MSARRLALALLLAAAAWLALVPAAPGPLLVNRAGFSQEVTARDGTLLRLSLASDERYRLFVPLAEIPPVVVEATLLQEDRHFLRHPGVNPVALWRAFRETYLGGERRVGGSTLTMQLARLRFGLHTRTPGGKLRQIARALWLELTYTKAELLEAYLNLAPYGANVEGVGAASRVWFGKPVAELSLAEALTLAVLPKSPAARSPESEAGRRALSAARAALAARWREAHPGDAEVEAPAPLLRARAELEFRAPHLADRLLAERPFDARIPSTLDPRVQRSVERQIELHVERGRRFGIVNAAALVVDRRSMEVLAYVGSAAHGDASIQGPVDGVRARRSPGSALKPFLYALALDEGVIHPRSLVRDTAVSISAWNPENFDGRFEGPLSATDALVRSRNVPALALANALSGDGLYGLLARARIGGLRERDFYGLALALGGAELRLDELVGLYAMLGNEGELRPLVLRRDDPTAATATRLLSAEAAHLVVEMLRANPRPGAARLVGDGAARRAIPWKTGTSFGFRDAWALGLVGPYAVGVWIGNFDGTPKPAFVGREAAGPLFFGIADALRAAGGAREPSSARALALARAKVCALSGALPGPHCHGLADTWLIPGVSPIASCAIHREVALEAATGLRACPGQTRGVRREVYEFWPSDLAALFASAGIARRAPPEFAPACRGAAGVVVAGGAPLRIESPQARVSYALRDGSADEVPFSAIADADGARVYWFVDDAYVGETRSGATLFWRARPGRFAVRAVDALGRGETRTLEVEVVGDGRAPRAESGPASLRY